MLSTSILKKFLVLVFLCQSITLKKFKLNETSYGDFYFVPKSTDILTPFTINPEKLIMKRTFLTNNKFTHQILYIPEEIGIIYYQPLYDSTVYFNLISPEFPFVYFDRVISKNNYAKTCTYTDFINNPSFQKTLVGETNIDQYISSYDFTDEQVEEYFNESENGPFMSEFERDVTEDVNGSYEEIDIDFANITLELNNTTWDEAKQKVIEIEYFFPQQRDFENYYKGKISEALTKLDGIIQKKWEGEDEKLGKWSSFLEKLKSDLEPIYAQIKAISAPMNSKDDIKLQNIKKDLAVAYSNPAQAIMTKNYNEFLRTIKLDLPLFVSIYQKANYNSNAFEFVKSANDILEADISSLSNNEYDVKKFVNVYTQLNFHLLQNIFIEINKVWTNSKLGEEINNIDYDIKKVLVYPIDDFLSENDIDNKEEFLDGYDIWRWIFDRVVDSHPFFTMFFDKFNEIVEEELKNYYESIDGTKIMEKYKTEAGETFDGKGFKAFTSKHYRMNLKICNPYYEVYMTQMSNGNIFTEIGRRILI